MRFSTLFLLAVISILTYAADDGGAPQLQRPVRSVFMVEGGSAHLADTYLTPLHYSGWHVAIMAQRSRAARFSPHSWTTQGNMSVAFDNAENPARNATMQNLELTASYGILRRWTPITSLPRLTVALGPALQARAGVYFLSRNGNNPAAAKGAITADMVAKASMPISLGKLPVTLSYAVQLPATGVFFAPQYGQLYYEIWLGQHSGLAHPAWWGNYFNIDNQVSLDIPLRNTSLRLSYHNTVLSTHVNHITTRCVTHAVGIGFVMDWQAISPRKSHDANVIFSL